MYLTVLLLVGGGALLVGGAELLVRGASRLAIALGISPLVVGLTIVAFSTSAPEFAVTIGAAYSGEAELALGNVIGSNIFNLLFILGLSAAITPLIVHEKLVRVDVPIMIGVSFGAAALSLDGVVGRLDGALLFAGIIGYTVLLIRQSRKESAGAEEEASLVEPEATARHAVRNTLLVLAGLALLTLGSRWLVAGSVAVAGALGVSELVIGLTIVAAGTSLPEVATSILASLRGERDIAVGNLVGSNLFNLLGVLGLGGLVAPAGIPVPPGALTFDVPIMIAAAVATLPIVFTNYTIARWEGLLLFGFYLAYTLFLVLEAAEHPSLHDLSFAMTYFVLPLVTVTLAVLSARAFARGRSGASEA